MAGNENVDSPGKFIVEDWETISKLLGWVLMRGDL